MTQVNKTQASSSQEFKEKILKAPQKFIINVWKILKERIYHQFISAIELVIKLIMLIAAFVFPSYLWKFGLAIKLESVPTVITAGVLFLLPFLGMSFHKNNTKEHKNWQVILIMSVGYMVLTFVFPGASEILTQAFGENTLEYLQKTFTDLNQESALIFSFVCISLTLLVILIKRHWFVATSLIGIFIASFVLLAPSILKGIERFGQLIAEQGLGIFLIVVVSGIVLPFMVYSSLNSKKSPIKSNTPPNFDIIKFAAIRALIVPGLIFSFINSADINLGIPDKYQEASQVNITSDLPQE